MKNKLQLILKILVYITVLILVIIFVDRNYNDFKKIFSLPTLCIFINCLLIALGFLLEGVKLKIVLKSFQVNISFFRINLLTYVRCAGNLLFYKLGTTWNMVHLKKRFGLDYTKSFSSFLFLQMLNILLMAFFALVGFILLNKVFFSIVLAAGIIGAVLVFYYLTGINIRPDNRLKKIITELLDAFNKFKKNKKGILYFILVDTVTFIFQNIKLYTISYYTGFNLSLINILFISVSFFIVKTISVIPSNLGIREGVSGLITKMFDNTYKIGILLCLFERIITMITIFILGAVSYSIIKFQDRKE